MSLDDFNFRITSDGKVETHGIDWGRPLVILHRNANHVVVRRAGHMTWCGVGSPQYYVETLYMLLKLKNESKVSAEKSLDGRAFTRSWASILKKREPGRKWKPVVTELIADCNLLGKGIPMPAVMEPKKPRAAKPKREPDNNFKIVASSPHYAKLAAIVTERGVYGTLSVLAEVIRQHTNPAWEKDPKLKREQRRRAEAIATSILKARDAV